MSYKIRTISVFDKNLKKHAKKYPFIKTDFAEFLESLAKNPEQGIALGNNSYKIRMKITGKNKGKSGGARIISHIVVHNEIVYLLTIYDKSEYSAVSDKQIAELINRIEN